MSYRCALSGTSQPFLAKTSAASIVLFRFRMGSVPLFCTLRMLMVGLVQRWSQSSSFCAGEGSCAFSIGGGGRPLFSRSNRFATAVVLSLARRDYRKQSLWYVVVDDPAVIRAEP